MPSRYVLHRDDTGYPLGIVSGRYNIVQPRELLETYDRFAGDLGFELMAAGPLLGGKKIWALAASESKIKLPGGDSLERYLLFATSFDTSTKTVVMQMSNRPFCSNQLPAMLAGKYGNAISISHLTAFDSERVMQEMELDESWSAFASTIKSLVAKKTTDEVAREFFLDVFYPEALRKTEAFSEKGADRRVDALMDILSEAPGQEVKAARGTAWGLVNAVTYYVDHEARSKSDDVRLDKAWFGEGANIKERALERAVEFAGVSDN
jgi:phage/plasmid-like protein (TIGR03299 family)